MRGELLEKEVAAMLISEIPKESMDYELVNTEDDFCILVRSKSTGLVEEVHHVKPQGENLVYLPDRPDYSRAKRKRRASNVLTYMLLAIVVLTAVGGVLCHFGIIR